jgi:hypothetical protein
MLAGHRSPDIIADREPGPDLADARCARNSGFYGPGSVDRRAKVEAMEINYGAEF